MQHFLNRAVWDTDGVAADLREFVVDHLGEPDGVLVIDETGDVKKGNRTVGVQRQYTGTAGRIENAQVAVYLTYTTAGRVEPLQQCAQLDLGGVPLGARDRHLVQPASPVEPLVSAAPDRQSIHRPPPRRERWIG